MNLRPAVRILPPILGTLAALAFLAYVARPHWADALVASRSLDPTWITAGILGLAVHLAIAFLIWRLCLRAGGATVSRGVAADTWVPTLLLRYLPGRFWAPGIRVTMAHAAGIPMPQFIAAMAWEILMAIVVGSAVALLASQGAPIDPRLRFGIVALLVAGLSVVAIQRLFASRFFRRPLLRRIGVPAVIAPDILVRLAAAHLAGWAIYGFAHWAFVRAMVPVTLADFRVVIAGVALAWIGGFVAVLTPAGVGVREGLLALLLGPVLGPGPVVLLAGVSRLGTIGLEILLFAGWSVARLRRPKSTPKDTPP